MKKAISVVHVVKKWMSFIVLILMMLIVVISIIELGILLYQDLFDPTDDVLFLEIDELFKIFSFFFIILIGFELIETVEMYFKDNVIHAEVVLLVAVIAVSRKVILLDLEKYEPLAIVGLGVIILALGGCYSLIKISYRNRKA
ncbi:phosphate-starvation-inducible PsiE family protein [Aestuariirhabdus sp. Z084]|uniref:phosphate-starvation-inducible PsiE family protein n=1 Tax=Aestuariirhabdus haliotis TaxID=2918751 RepID=UPI00201B3FDC|nr:phosphate-starvation-inducible PsiE family protein [Aestuariirhabdus haliotis]MCL6416744.1 phosphate-starvation-inducible PsiE family protein [Aestuariirhabdus haliotis]MCL6420744.1 phosphate-starvation-inducible PsiE family protein [Aestuariirhabdus haliotis]